MKAFIKNSALFILISSLLYVLLLLAWGTFLPDYFNKNMRYKLGYYGFMNSRLKEIETLKKCDILILGSSHAYKGFDPRIFKQFGFTIFNLGSSNQTPLQSNLLLQKYLPLVQPKLVILEVYPEGLEMDGVESAVDIISNTPKLEDAYQHAHAVNDLTAYNTLVYSALRRIIFNDQSFTEAVKIDKDTYISGGYVERNLEYNTQKPSALEQKWKIRPKQLEALKSSISLLNQKNIPFILVQAPITKQLKNSYSNSVEMDTLYLHLGPYYNFSTIHTSILSDSLDFYDLHHLNQTGVVKFNMAFINDNDLFLQQSIYAPSH
ncbi:MAG: hypothetical protein CFE21_09790 [Bacteroidetes bacterium B1(2017)]|nr:MAG: hypothetical protein CFE21_09790 [Bacteroidetes bacterium B1(2017)]